MQGRIVSIRSSRFVQRRLIFSDKQIGVPAALVRIAVVTIVSGGVFVPSHGHATRGIAVVVKDYIIGVEWRKTRDRFIEDPFIKWEFANMHRESGFVSRVQ